MPPAAVYRDPCNGHFTHRQAVGCCPIEITAANRAVGANGNRTATLTGLLPTALQGAVSNADLAYFNVIDHRPDHAFNLGGADAAELVNAAKGGVISPGDAMAEMATRIPGAGAEDQNTLKSCISALESLVRIGHIGKSISDIKGNFVRMWALSVKKVKSLTGPVMVVDGSTMSLEDFESESGRKPKLSVERLTSEQHFDTAIYQFSLIAHATAVMPFEISTLFIFEVAHLLRIKHGEDFWVAQEYLIACLDLLDRGVCKAQDIPNYDRGIMLDDARRFAEKFMAVHAKKTDPLGAPFPSDKPSMKSWNGECQPCDSKANLCPFYNRNKAHDDPKKLDKNGKCIFRHLCNHWVTDKGPSGRCMAATHGWHNCTNPNKCDKALD